ncbi:hypothetical protein [Flavobacterium sp. HNIBRBA15423]|uniref:hypothetical protein n=1 Tax=Flavobacterium sp. HNIBRBA15423 TaxID=3458683 RepID=UPI004043CA58
MKKKDIQSYVNNNLENLPLLFRELVFKDKECLHESIKETKSEKYSDESYMIYKFYKPISRF